MLLPVIEPPPSPVFKAQQWRNAGNSTPSRVTELRRVHASWARAFDVADKSGKGHLDREETCRAFQVILGGEHKEMPRRKLLEIFDEIRRPGLSCVDFRGFHQLVKQVSEYMSETPAWRQREEEARAREEEEEEAEELRRLTLAPTRRRGSWPLDIYELCGIEKTQELREVEQRKEEALERARLAARTKLRAATNATKVVRRINKLMLATQLQKKGVSVEGTGAEEPASMLGSELPEVRPPSGNRGRVTRPRPHFKLERGATIDLATDLPELKTRGYGSSCLALRFSPDGSRLAAGYFDGCLRIFDVDKGKQMNTLGLSCPYDVSLVDTPAGGADLRLWERRFSGAAITNVRWVPLARQLAVVTVDTEGTIGMWDLTRGRAPRVLWKKECGGQLSALACTRDGERMLSAGMDKVVKVYDVETGCGVHLHEQRTVGGQWSGLGKNVAGHSLKILSLCCDPENPDIFASGGLDKQVLLWDLRAGTMPVASIQGTCLGGDALDFSADGTTLLAGSHRVDAPLQLFDLRVLQPKPAVLQAAANYAWSGEHSGAVSDEKQKTSMVFSTAWDYGSNKFIAAAGERENMGRVFRRPQCLEDPMEVVVSFSDQNSAVYAAAVDDQARHAAFGGADGSVRFANLSGLS